MQGEAEGLSTDNALGLFFAYNLLGHIEEDGRDEIAMKTRTKKRANKFRPNTVANMELHSVEAAVVTYRGRQAVRLVEKEDDAEQVEHAFAMLAVSDFGSCMSTMQNSPV